MRKGARAKKRSFGRKTAGYYLRVIVISLVAFVVVFMGGTSLFKPQPPCANAGTCKDLSEKIENGAIGMFQGREVTPPKINIALDNTRSLVLGENTPSGEKHIYIDLAAQSLYAYQGNKKIMQALISSGRWGRTPAGNFHIWHKVRSTRMAGGSGNDAYNLPNVPHVMFFYRDFGLHGAYWHNNFGHTMSHGCVNMRQVDAEALFNWADGPKGGTKGTAVSVCDQFSEIDILCTQKNPVQS